MIETVLLQRRTVPAVEARPVVAASGADAPANVSPPPGAATAPSPTTPATEDVVAALTAALRSTGEAPSPVRPLDVQYWACWVALALAVVLSTVLVVLG